MDIKKGDKVRTVYGDIETVLSIPSDVQIITEESARKNAWYHPSKITKVTNAFENGAMKAVTDLRFGNMMTPPERMPRRDLKLYLKVLEAGPSSWNDLLKKEVAKGLNVQAEIAKVKQLLGE